MKVKSAFKFSSKEVALSFQDRSTGKPLWLALGIDGYWHLMTPAAFERQLKAGVVCSN